MPFGHHLRWQRVFRTWQSHTPRTPGTLTDLCRPVRYVCIFNSAGSIQDLSVKRCHGEPCGVTAENMRFLVYTTAILALVFIAGGRFCKTRKRMSNADATATAGSPRPAAVAAACLTHTAIWRPSHMSHPNFQGGRWCSRSDWHGWQHQHSTDVVAVLCTLLPGACASASDGDMQTVNLPLPGADVTAAPQLEAGAVAGTDVSVAVTDVRGWGNSSETVSRTWLLFPNCAQLRKRGCYPGVGSVVPAELFGSVGGQQIPAELLYTPMAH